MAAAGNIAAGNDVHDRYVAPLAVRAFILTKIRIQIDRRCHGQNPSARATKRKPRALVTNRIAPPRILALSPFTCEPSSSLLLASLSRKIATIGSSSPLAIWAMNISSTGRYPSSDASVPVAITISAPT